MKRALGKAVHNWEDEKVCTGNWIKLAKDRAQ
jgi:hypothetical protein